MELFGDRAPEVMSDRELVHALDQADADLARIGTRRLRLVAALDKSGYAEQGGARDTVQYLEYRYRLDHYRARRDVQLARALPKYPAVTAALPDTTDLPDPAKGEGEETVPAVLLRPAQAEAIITALEKVPATVPVADLEVAEQELVRLAKHLPPAELRKAAEQARDILDTDGPEPEERKAAARESLTLMTADRGVKFKGYLANENAELFRSLIFAGAGPHKTIDGQPDPRSREKRQADALTTTLTLAATALDAGTPSPTIPRPTADTADTAADCATAQTRDGEANGADGSSDSGSDGGSDAGSAGGSAGGRKRGGTDGQDGDVVPGFGAKANITVTIDLQDLKAATADAIGDTVYSSGLSAATIRRLACDANVIPIVLGSNSEPLDVGRSERLVTRAIRRALNTRDRGCVVCGAPPIMCDAHHLTSWIDGGDTKTTNLVLLCRRHHTDLHNGHWIITITNGEVHVTRPTWADPPPHPSPRASAAPPDRPAPDHSAPDDHSEPDRPAPDHSVSDRPAPDHSVSDRPAPDHSTRGRLAGDHSAPDDRPEPDRPAPDHSTRDRLAADRSELDRSAPDHSAAGEGVAGDLRSGEDGGSVPPDESVRSASGDSVTPATTDLRLSARDERLRDEAPSDGRPRDEALSGGRLRDEAPAASAEDDAAAVRDATYLAIWGECPPAIRPTKSADRLSDRTPLDPWGRSGDLSPAATAPDPP
jgi:hypothetical protein